tara:strand:+ start:550 stop:798 length:249 start_codon:yes stop_codon:yes gene_type:complete
MGKTQHGGKRVKRRSTYKKAGSTKPLTLLKSLAGASKKNIKVGRKLVRNDFLKKSLGVRFPKVFAGGRRKTRIRAHKSRKHN